MERMKVTCGNCGGTGYVNERIVPTGDYIICKVEKDICEACDGKGYTEYASFSIEEANVILKHCGLTTES